MHIPKDNPRRAAVRATAIEALERFLEVNPSRRPRAFVRVTYQGSRYRAAYGYTSDQGTSTVGVVREGDR
jgi:hypothetical protein